MIDHKNKVITLTAVTRFVFAWVRKLQICKKNPQCQQQILLYWVLFPLWEIHSSICSHDCIVCWRLLKRREQFLFLHFFVSIINIKLSIPYPKPQCQSPDNAVPVEEKHSCMLPKICLTTVESMIKTHAPTHTNRQECLLQNKEEARFQGQENKAWMEKGILSHVSTFRSKLWQTGFGPLCTWRSSQGLSVMGSDLGLMPWSTVRQNNKKDPGPLLFWHQREESTRNAEAFVLAWLPLTKKWKLSVCFVVSYQ